MKLLLFDAGGTLVFPNWWRISATLARHGVTVDPAALEKGELRARRRLDDPSIIARSTDAGRWSLFFEEILLECGIGAAPPGAFAELKAYHDEQNLWEHVPDGVRQALHVLRGRRKAVVSNANGTVAAKLDRVGLAAHFETIVDSHDHGVEKPDPRLFRIALERLGVPPSETVYVGDVYHIDVVGARAAGIEAVLLDPLGLHADKDCRRVRSLEEFAASVASGD